MKRLTLLFIVGLLTFNTFAQERERTPIGGRPDIKGDLFLDFGFNTLNNKPDDLQTRFFPSRTFNAYYQHPFNLFGEGSGFTFNPGIGIGTDKLAFTEGRTLFNNPAVGTSSSRLQAIRDVYGNDIQVNTNVVAVNYIDIPLEIRYHFNKSNYKKSMRVAVGGKVGFLMNAHTKVAFEDANGLERKIKDRQNYGFAPIRYGVHTRLGFPGFNIWGYYGLNQVFQKDKGPFGTEANQINFGVSFALF
ncbi:porin family protein [Belliella kenyensis]|uniref:Porin family protein n=1 Tax=Belliella kenyensis TaxID=1472724 RepID=A0ABV8ENJ1_9BACT|nr:porin family protein [Belliella kenyensis]MCH7403669.1 PorT family protein [Belliella kenyensis]MDN3602177.1 porin family protein [Belliella kenyensis]